MNPQLNWTNPTTQHNSTVPVTACLVHINTHTYINIYIYWPYSWFRPHSLILFASCWAFFFSLHALETRERNQCQSVDQENSALPPRDPSLTFAGSHRRQPSGRKRSHSAHVLQVQFNSGSAGTRVAWFRKRTARQSKSPTLHGVTASPGNCFTHFSCSCESVIGNARK